MMAGWFGLLFAAGAAAHQPHDKVFVVSVPPALDDRAPWVAHTFGEAYRSTDGHDWEPSAGPLMALTPLDATSTAGGEAVMCTTSEVLWSTDGVAWSRTDAPAALTGCEAFGDALYLTSPTGLWSGPTGGPWAEVAASPFGAPRATETALTAVSTDGGQVVVVIGAEPAAIVDAPVGAALRSAVAVHDGALRMFAGDAAGGVWSYADGAWAACGALPEQSEPAIVELDLDGASLMVAPSEHGPYLSDDACATWSDRRVPDRTEFAPVSGGATTDEESYVALEIAGDHVFIAGWAGGYVSEDLGQTWEELPYGWPQRSEGVAFAPDFPTDPLMLVAMFSIAVSQTFDGGQTMQSPNWGMVAENIETVTIAPDDGSLAAAKVNQLLWLSSDGGSSWRQPAVPPNMAVEIHDFASDDLWVYQSDAAAVGALDTPLVRATNREDFAPLYALDAAAPGASSPVRFTADGATRYCVASNTLIVCAPDALGPWTEVATLPPGRPGTFAAYPVDDPDVMVFGHDGGRLYLSTDRGDSWTLVEELPYESWAAVKATPDGWLWAFSATGAVYRSTDGASWTHELELSHRPWAVSIRPDYADYPEMHV